MKKIKIIQIKSCIGVKKNHKIKLKLLGLNKINDFIIKKFDNNLKKFLINIYYLIKCKNIYEIK